ncbi:PAS domain-containing sensor histidine kinase [Parvibaculum lavamentivorans]|uniref:PAS domain-containing sensor histidine kinase n=1 Tax=Parvibaculum lavamentivorans TaxID=256618 RepID=UPI0002F00829|nr:PAS domain-containing sensor histidine kinase [Parvibaculum lavamentivorans]
MPEVQAASEVECSYRWTGEFADPALEAGYLRASWTEAHSRLKALLIAIYVFVSWAAFDLVAMGFGWPFVLLTVARFAALGSTLLALKVFRTPDNRSAFMICAGVTQAIVCIVAPLSLMLGGVQFAAALLSIVVILFAFYVGVPSRLPVNLALSASLSLGFVAVTPFLTEVSLLTILEIGVLFMVVNAIGAELVRSANRLRRTGFLTLMRQQELYEQLKREVEVRQEAEQAVRATEESFQSIFYAAPLPISLVDPSTFRVMQANMAALALFGIDETEADGFDVREFFDEEDLPARLDRLVLGGRAGAPVEFCLKRRDGAVIWALVSAAVVSFHGRRALLIGIQDVTVRHKEAEALREARDQATAASRSKSEFLANMSHELRTPLNAIIGFSEALERELFGPVGNPRYREYAEDIHDSGVHLLSLINDILDLSKIEAGHFKLHEDETDLDHIVAAATRIVRHRAQQANIAIECRLPQPPLAVLVDERALKQVLINLVSNAVKFSPDGSLILVEANVTTQGLRISVADKGVGIAPEDIPRALTPFTQLDGSLSRAHEGTGLGLPLAKHLTELHDGKLFIESAVDVGTTVYVDLPLSRVVGHAEQKQAIV